MRSNIVFQSVWSNISIETKTKVKMEKYNYAHQDLLSEHRH